MTKGIIVLVLFGLLFQSCTFIFYNYRGYLDTEYSIINESSDTNVRVEVANYIYGQSTNKKFYDRFINSTSDSIYFYGPDYHHFYFKIYELNKMTKVHFIYSGYNGFRSRPPHKEFIQTLSDSLKVRFGATQTIIKDLNNEKKARR